MKKLLQLGLLAFALLAVNPFVFSQKIAEGVVKFEMKMDEANQSPEMAMMGSMSLDFYFTKTQQRVDMNLMGGMMRMQTFVPNDNPKDAAMLMDMFGQKYHIIELAEEDISGSNNFMDMDNIEEVEYDESDTKEIAGYDCYRAYLTAKDGTKMKYYITEKIAPPMPPGQDSAPIKGYPLEMEMDAQGMLITFVATEVSDQLPEGSFAIPDGYQKMTMEEFEKSMGEMDMGF